jgi:uncharacterized protein YjiS (DUF1127 family)
MQTTTISLSPGLATKAQRALQALATSLSRVYRHWLRAREVHATARALNQLDDRVLKDLGLDRSELLSAAAELSGRASGERQRIPYVTPLPR